MIKELNKTTTLIGKSRNEYEFSLFSFDDFDDVKKSFIGGGLYLFTYRYKIDEYYKHQYIYLGQTGDYNTCFDNHNKEFCIRLRKSNCIGFYSMSNITEQERKIAEKDLLDNYIFPCNTSDN